MANGLAVNGSHGAFHDGALTLALVGIPVHPLRPDKRPLTTHGHKDATTDPLKIKDWAALYPDALVGVPTGDTSGFLVVDIDVDPGKGIDGFATLRKNGWVIPLTQSHRTRRGGMHYLFRMPADMDVRNSAGMLGSGIDIRGNGGYVVHWPAHGGEVEHAGVIAEPPEWLLAGQKIGTSSLALASANATTGAIVPEGSRNNAMASFAGKLRRAGLGDAEVEAVARIRNERSFSPPLDDDELKRIVQSICRYPVGSIDIDSVDFAPIVAPKDGDAARVADVANAVSSIRFPITFGDQLENEAPAAWVVEGVLPEAALGVVYGASGAGKSFLVLDLVAAIAEGKAWRGLTTKQGLAVYIVAEGANGFPGRIAALRKETGMQLKNLGIVRLAPNFLMKDDVRAFLESLRPYGRPRVIVIDTMAQVMPGGNENSGEDVGTVLKHCRALHEATGALILLMHHPGKDSTKGARGWSGLRAACDVEIEVERIGEFHTARITKMKDGDDQAVFGFKLRKIDIGVSDDGTPISSLVVDHGVDDAAAASARKAIKGLGKGQARALHILEALAVEFDDDGDNSRWVQKDEWREALAVEGCLGQVASFYRQSFSRILKSLETRGRIVVRDDAVSVV